jgi:drug/metabolite transporter (DMT)-like permease
MQHIERSLYGLSLSLLTALMWGTLPLAMQLLLSVMDASTITWVRFLFSSFFVASVLLRRGQLPQISNYSSKILFMIAIAVIALVSNFNLYLMGLDRLNPESSGVIIQLAPFILMLGSVIFYGERMSILDIIGAFVLLLGLMLFFNERLSMLFASLGSYTIGVVLMLLAAICWSIYGLMQKALLRDMTSMQLTLLIYAGGTVLLFFVSSPSTLFQLTPLTAALTLYGCMNMVLGYGAFTEAMRVWQAAKVSAVIALAPIVTIVSMKIAGLFWPDLFIAQSMNLWAYVGAFLVVTGSMLAALARTHR